MKPERILSALAAVQGFEGGYGTGYHPRSDQACQAALKLPEGSINKGILLVIDYLPEDIEARYYYRLLSQFLTPIRIEPITYEPESIRFIFAICREN